MNTKLTPFLIPVIVLVFSCEKVIDVAVNSAEKQIVVEAQVQGEGGETFVLLSYSSDVYAENGFDKISGASISVTDKFMNQYVFTEVDTVPGRYECPTLYATENNEYHLNVQIGEKLITSTGYTYSKPLLDSVTVEQSEFGEDLAGFLGYLPYLATAHATDDPSRKNYYQALVWLNEEPTRSIYITTDDQLDGTYFQAPFFGDLARAGDTMRVVLLSIDKGFYDFMSSVGNANNSTPFSAAPTNPKSNLKGDNVLGYFVATLSDTVDVYIPN